LPDFQGDKYSPFLYDAVMMYAIALNETLSKGLDPSNGLNVVKNLRLKSFSGTRSTHIMIDTIIFVSIIPGMSGSIVLDDLGDREPDYWIMDMNPYTGYFVKIAEVLNKDLGVRVSSL
jgi:hypothetical protein